ncbi:MAG: T9SS type A sorting domain-containing protein [Bacteroidetes bacterium]|nr:MAG: T9SS type A sorting domain-containing protein [Bacteroidota bacterium]
MKITTSILLLFLLSTSTFSQSTGPWQRPLIQCISQDGINFTGCTLFQDSSGVPSMTMDSSGRLFSAFQWFPDPFQGPHWDSVAVKISLDSGQTWSLPQPIVLHNFPSNFQRPFDPTLVALPGGDIRIYFSSGPPGMNTIGTYSAIGTDGVHYTFEQGVRFSQVGRNCIDPAVTIFRDTFHYTSPKGAPQDGAFHAVSTDGLNFSQVADISSDAQHNWTGNMMVDSLALKFYGSGGQYMWFSATGNGNVWSPYQHLNLSGGDPAIIKIPGRNHILIYTGPPVISGLSEVKQADNIIVYPNPVLNTLHVSGISISGAIKFSILDINGRLIQHGFLTENKNEIALMSKSAGLHLLILETEHGLSQTYFQVLN